MIVCLRETSFIDTPELKGMMENFMTERKKEEKLQMQLQEREYQIPTNFNISQIQLERPEN